MLLEDRNVRAAAAAAAAAAVDGASTASGASTNGRVFTISGRALGRVASDVYAYFHKFLGMQARARVRVRSMVGIIRGVRVGIRIIVMVRLGYPYIEIYAIKN